MGFLERAIKRGVSNAVEKAVGNAVKEAVQPKANELANRAANQLEQAANSASQQVNQTASQVNQANQTTQQTSNLSGAFANLQRSMEGLANQAAKNMKICPACGATATAEQKFCPSCGEKLPEQTVAQGAVCSNCGKQNSIGTKFCQECGTKLPFAAAEEQVAADKDAAVLAQWDIFLQQYPKWNLGGNGLQIENGEGYIQFSVTFQTSFAAQNAVNQYKEILNQNGFRMAGEYPDRDHLYKMINGVCYHVDTEHCFEGDSETADFYFLIGEPTGGFNYVKPEPKSKSNGLFGFFK